MEVVQAPGHTKTEGESTPSQILTSKEVAQSTYNSIQIGDIFTENWPFFKVWCVENLEKIQGRANGQSKDKR